MLSIDEIKNILTLRIREGEYPYLHKYTNSWIVKSFKYILMNYYIEY